MVNRQVSFYYLKIYNVYYTICLNHICVTSAAFLACGRTAEEAYSWIFEHALTCVLAWDRMLRAAGPGKLELTREAPQRPDPVLYNRVPPRTPLLSKNSYSGSVAPLFPLLSQQSDSFTISTEIPVYFFSGFCLLFPGFD